MKIKLKDPKTFLAILAISILICSNFLQMHYSSDTYVLMDLGYQKYPSEYFLLDGRFISAIICYLAGFLNLDYNIYIIAMDFLAIIFLSIATYQIFMKFQEIFGLQDKKDLKWLLLALASYVLIFNQYTLELLVFPESAVMCLGVLLCIKSAILVVTQKPKKYLKITLMMLISTFCYQGQINIFPIIAIVLIFMQNANSDKPIKEKIVEFIKEMLKIGAILIILITVALCSIKISQHLIGTTLNRGVTLNDKADWEIRVRIVKKYIDALWVNSMNMLPKNTTNIIIIITTILLILQKNKKEYIFKYLFTIFAVFCVCVIPMFIFNTGACGRVNIPMSEILGISLIFILKNMAKDRKYINKIIILLVIGTFMFNNIMLIRNSTEHIAANRVDQNDGQTIKRLLEEYESQSGKTVTKFGWFYDKNPGCYSVGIKQIGSLTERKFSCYWCINEAINFYCERDFEKLGRASNIIYENEELRLKIMELQMQDFNEFSEKQVVFYEDIMLLCIY